MQVEIPQLDIIETRLAALESTISRMTATKRYYNVKESAQQLNVSVKTVRRYLAKGYLKRSLAGRTIQIPIEAIKDFSKNNVR